MNQLELVGIKKSFGDTQVIPSIDLEVVKGETLALVGESGCGKTTILRIIAGLETPDAGKLILDGMEITALAPEKRRVGMVFQDLALFPHMTIEQNVAFGLKKKNPDKVHELLELTELNALKKRYPHELSGGQQQRVAIARTLGVDPDLLLLDEPFSSLDEVTHEKVRTEIHKLIQSLGITTILVTHHPIDSFMMADRVAVLQNGELLQIGTPKDIYVNPSSAYVAGFLGTQIVLSATAESGKAETTFGHLDIPLHESSTLILRPENIILERNNGPLSGQVISKMFKGQHEVLIIQNDDKTETLSLETEHSDFTSGDRIYLQPQLDKIKVLKLNELEKG